MLFPNLVLWIGLLKQHMNNSEYTYEYLIDEFAEDVLINRFLFICEMTKKFIKSYSISNIVDINEYLIWCIVVDYYADVSRLKKFHGIEKINYIKIASYLSYWVYKRKPLHITKQIDKYIIKEKPYLQSVNEWFCIFVINSILYDLHKPILESAGEKSYANFQRLLWYNFCYRTITPQSIELALVGVETIGGFIKKGTLFSD